MAVAPRVERDEEEPEQEGVQGPVQPAVGDPASAGGLD